MEPQPIKDVLPQIPTLTLREVLESYNDVTLTEEEETQALIDAKRKKKEMIRLQRVRDQEKFNREHREGLFNFDVIRTFMINRSISLFSGKFEIDEYNESVFNLLSYYFTNNPMFVTISEKMGISNPSLDKGILMCGVYGTGKSWMMKLFQKNARQVYIIRTSKEIAESYTKLKEIPKQYLEPIKNAINDQSLFCQPYSGLCIDEIGAERVKNSYGNISNVIGDLLEIRYNYLDEFNNRVLVGPTLHGITNLTPDQLKEHYDGRVYSRMCEIFNYVELPGEDRRKK